jgi:hypothetical protein
VAGPEKTKIVHKTMYSAEIRPFLAKRTAPYCVLVNKLSKDVLPEKTRNLWHTLWRKIEKPLKYQVFQGFWRRERDPYIHPVERQNNR